MPYLKRILERKGWIRPPKNTNHSLTECKLSEHSLHGRDTTINSSVISASSL